MKIENVWLYCFGNSKSKKYFVINFNQFQIDLKKEKNNIVELYFFNSL